MRICIVAALSIACAGAPVRGETDERSVVAPRAALSEEELADLRDIVSALEPGADRASVETALGSALAGIGAIGTGPTHEVTEVYALGDHNVLWLTWNATDASAVVLRRAALWNEATDPMPAALPYPP
jgi:hypothetical protein